MKTLHFDQRLVPGAETATFIGEIHYHLRVLINEVAQETDADYAIISPTALTIVQSGISANDTQLDFDRNAAPSLTPEECDAYFERNEELPPRRVGYLNGLELRINCYLADYAPVQMFRGDEEVGQVTIDTQHLSFL